MEVAHAKMKQTMRSAGWEAEHTLQPNPSDLTGCPLGLSDPHKDASALLGGDSRGTDGVWLVYRMSERTF